MITINDISRALESWAPKNIQQSYDNVGLQVGRPDTPVKSVLIALDLTLKVIHEAIETGANLLITHHPNIFKPIKSVSPSGLTNYLALLLAENGIAHYTIHTNLDAAPDGVSFALAKQLGLSEIDFLSPLHDEQYLLKATIEPQQRATFLEKFENLGFQQTLASATENGSLTVEVIFEKWELSKASFFLANYTCYLFPIKAPSFSFGMGAIGKLKNEITLEVFLEHVCEKLGTPAVRVTGDLSTNISTVAVCGGSGSSLIGDALTKQVDAFVTADITYHTNFQVYDLEGKPTMALIDVGHYESEAITEKLLLDWLKERFPSIPFKQTMVNTNPTKIFVANKKKS